MTEALFVGLLIGAVVGSFWGQISASRREVRMIDRLSGHLEPRDHMTAIRRARGERVGLREYLEALHIEPGKLLEYLEARDKKVQELRAYLRVLEAKTRTRKEQRLMAYVVQEINDLT